MLYTFYVSRMKGEDEGTYYLLKMSNLCKNYVLLGADDVHLRKLYEEVCTELVDHGKQSGYSLDDYG